jgi:type III pantothenate kinase
MPTSFDETSTQMLLVIDAGNSHVVIALHDAGHLRGPWRLKTDPARTSTEYGLLLSDLVRQAGARPEALRGIVLASVAPRLSRVLFDAASDFLGHPPATIGNTLTPRIRVHYDPPGAVGADRVLNALAAHRKYGGPALVVDLGTATTLDAVNAAGEFVGGAIAPGIGISLDALSASAGHLPRAELDQPGSVLGRSTMECLRSGAYYGFLGQLEGLIGRASSELGPETQVIATGGFGPWLAGVSALVHHLEPHLTLDGLRIAWEEANTAEVFG